MPISVFHHENNIQVTSIVPAIEQSKLTLKKLASLLTCSHQIHLLSGNSKQNLTGKE